VLLDEDAVQQCGLTGSQEAGQYRDGTRESSGMFILLRSVAAVCPPDAQRVVARARARR
jgi:hypothetical protein